MFETLRTKANTRTLSALMAVGILAGCAVVQDASSESITSCGGAALFDGAASDATPVDPTTVRDETIEDLEYLQDFLASSGGDTLETNVDGYVMGVKLEDDRITLRTDSTHDSSVDKLLFPFGEDGQIEAGMGALVCTTDVGVVATSATEQIATLRSIAEGDPQEQPG